MGDQVTRSVIEGGCLCGQVRYRVNGNLRGVVNCHCGQCRRTHGHFAAYTDTLSDALTFEKDDGLRWFRSSDFASRGFCSNCGASLFWKPVSGERISIAAGTLDAPTGLHTVSNIFCSHAGDYYTINDGLPAFANSDDVE